MSLVLKGKIIKGEGVGRKLGYPTANLDRRFFSRHPAPDGVWTGRVRVCKVRTGRDLSVQKVRKFGRWMTCAAVIGMEDRERGGKKVEVYILGFKKNIYGRYLEIRLVKRLRPLRKYRNDRLLIAQIKKDIIAAQHLL